MATMQFQVTGMSCGHCEAAIRSELGGLPGVSDVDVSAATGKLVVTGTDLDAATLIAAVQNAGYSAVASS